MGMDVGAKKGPRSDINITPLVDVVLVLLIIFMVLTPLMEKEIAVRVPEEPDQTQPVEPPPADLLQILFKVDEAGLFHVNNETLTDESARTPPKVTVTASVRRMAACSALATAAGYPAAVHASGRSRVAVLRVATVTPDKGEADETSDAQTLQHRGCGWAVRNGVRQ